MNDTQITITGNLTDAPELRYTQVSRGFTDSEGSSAANPGVGGG